MTLKEKPWSFTEILGYTNDVEDAIQTLRKKNLLPGNLSSDETKDNKHYVQYYQCNDNVHPLTPEEKEALDQIANQHRVHIEYSYKEQEGQHFPLNETNTFAMKYYEWWMRD